MLAYSMLAKMACENSTKTISEKFSRNLQVVEVYGIRSSEESFEQIDDHESRIMAFGYRDSLR